MDELRERPSVYDPWEPEEVRSNPDPETMAVSEFKATCLSVLARVKNTGREVLVTKRGVALARILPPLPPAVPAGDAFGAMAGTCIEVEDLLEPLPEEDWEALV